MTPSIRTLAKKAGVSTATVPLALRNASRISLTTRRKIQRLAREEGYSANPAVSRLFSHYRNREGATHLGTLAFVHTSPNPADRRVDTVRSWFEPESGF